MNPKWNGQFSCFDLVAKTDECHRSVVQVRDIEIGGSDFVVMAGPCAVESETQLLADGRSCGWGWRAHPAWRRL